MQWDGLNNPASTFLNLRELSKIKLLNPNHFFMKLRETFFKAYSANLLILFPPLNTFHLYSNFWQYTQLFFSFQTTTKSFHKGSMYCTWKPPLLLKFLEYILPIYLHLMFDVLQLNLIFLLGLIIKF